MGLFSSIKRLFGGGRKEGSQMTSLVVLLGKLRSFDKESVKQLICDTLGTEVKPIDLSLPDFAPDGFLFPFELDGSKFVLQYFPEPYDSFQEIKGTKEIEKRLLKAVETHQAWLSVDYYKTGVDISREEAYQVIGKIIAAVADSDTLAIYNPDGGRINLYADNVGEYLCSDNPFEAFNVKPMNHFVSVSADDPRMKEATEEAQRRWPEFVQAFKNPVEGQRFSVKAVFTEGEENEHIWLEVDSIGGDTVSGTIANECVYVKKVKEGDHVTVPIKDVDDWMVSTDEDIISGGFTTQILLDESEEE